MTCELCGIDVNKPSPDCSADHPDPVAPLRVIVHGNPIDGLSFSGPFDGDDLAVKFGSEELQGADWLVADLWLPPAPRPGDGYPHRWDCNFIQFARLIAEINATVELTPEQVRDLCESMDLSQDELTELFDRALEAWEEIKAQ